MRNAAEPIDIRRSRADVLFSMLSQPVASSVIPLHPSGPDVQTEILLKNIPTPIVTNSYVPSKRLQSIEVTFQFDY
eukprot:834334-Amphidinium_carterae.1